MDALGLMVGDVVFSGCWVQLTASLEGDLPGPARPPLKRRVVGSTYRLRPCASQPSTEFCAALIRSIMPWGNSFSGP